ncbi:MAG: EndoU domain-containing protein [Actinoallomurus sp.]
MTTVSPERRAAHEGVVYAVAERLHTTTTLLGEEAAIEAARDLSSRLADELGTRRRTGGAPVGGSRPPVDPLEIGGGGESSGAGAAASDTGAGQDTTPVDPEPPEYTPETVPPYEDRPVPVETIAAVAVRLRVTAEQAERLLRYSWFDEERFAAVRDQVGLDDAADLADLVDRIGRIPDDLREIASRLPPMDARDVYQVSREFQIDPRDLELFGAELRDVYSQSGLRSLTQHERLDEVRDELESRFVPAAQIADFVAVAARARVSAHDLRLILRERYGRETARALVRLRRRHPDDLADWADAFHRRHTGRAVAPTVAERAAAIVYQQMPGELVQSATGAPERSRQPLGKVPEAWFRDVVAQVEALLSRSGNDIDPGDQEQWATNRARRLVDLRRRGIGSEGGGNAAGPSTGPGGSARQRPPATPAEIQEVADRLAPMTAEEVKRVAKAYRLDPRDLLVFRERLAAHRMAGGRPRTDVMSGARGLFTTLGLGSADLRDLGGPVRGRYGDYSRDLAAFVSVAMRAGIEADDLLVVLDAAHRDERLALKDLQQMSSAHLEDLVRGTLAPFRRAADRFPPMAAHDVAWIQQEFGIKPDRLYLFGDQIREAYSRSREGGSTARERLERLFAELSTAAGSLSLTHLAQISVSSDIERATDVVRISANSKIDPQYLVVFGPDLRAVYAQARETGSDPVEAAGRMFAEYRENVPGFGGNLGRFARWAANADMNAADLRTVLILLKQNRPFEKTPAEQDIRTLQETQSALRAAADSLAGLGVPMSVTDVAQVSANSKIDPRYLVVFGPELRGIYSRPRDGGFDPVRAAGRMFAEYLENIPGFGGNLGRFARWAASADMNAADLRAVLVAFPPSKQAMAAPSQQGVKEVRKALSILRTTADSLAPMSVSDVARVSAGSTIDPQHLVVFGDGLRAIYAQGVTPDAALPEAQRLIAGYTPIREARQFAKIAARVGMDADLMRVVVDSAREQGLALTDLRNMDPSSLLGLVQSRREGIGSLPSQDRQELLARASQIAASHHEPLPVDMTTVSPERLALHERVVYAVAERYHAVLEHGDEDQARQKANDLASRLADGLGIRRRKGGAPPGRARPPVDPLEIGGGGGPSRLSDDDDAATETPTGTLVDDDAVLAGDVTALGVGAEELARARVGPSNDEHYRAFEVKRYRRADGEIVSRLVVPIAWKNPDAVSEEELTAFETRVRDDVHSNLNVGARLENGDLLRVEVEFVGTADGADARRRPVTEVTLLEEKARSNVVEWWIGEATAGAWAHEVLHILGLEDEYREIRGGRRPVYTDGSLMGSLSVDPYGRPDVDADISGRARGGPGRLYVPPRVLRQLSAAVESALRVPRTGASTDARPSADALPERARFSLDVRRAALHGDRDGVGGHLPPHPLSDRPAVVKVGAVNPNGTFRAEIPGQPVRHAGGQGSGWWRASAGYLFPGSVREEGSPPRGRMMFPEHWTEDDAVYAAEQAYLHALRHAGIRPDPERPGAYRWVGEYAGVRVEGQLVHGEFTGFRPADDQAGLSTTRVVPLPPEARLGLKFAERAVQISRFGDRRTRTGAYQVPKNHAWYGLDFDLPSNEGVLDVPDERRSDNGTYTAQVEFLDPETMREIAPPHLDLSRVDLPSRWVPHADGIEHTLFPKEWGADRVLRAVESAHASAAQRGAVGPQRPDGSYRWVGETQGVRIEGIVRTGHHVAFRPTFPQPRLRWPDDDPVAVTAPVTEYFYRAPDLVPLDIQHVLFSWGQLGVQLTAKVAFAAEPGVDAAVVARYAEAFQAAARELYGELSRPDGAPLVRLSVAIAATASAHHVIDIKGADAEELDDPRTRESIRDQLVALVGLVPDAAHLLAAVRHVSSPPAKNFTWQSTDSARLEPALRSSDLVAYLETSNLREAGGTTRTYWPPLDTRARNLLTDAVIDAFTPELVNALRTGGHRDAFPSGWHWAEALWAAANFASDPPGDAVAEEISGGWYLSGSWDLPGSSQELRFELTIADDKIADDRIADFVIKAVRLPEEGTGTGEPHASPDADHQHPANGELPAAPHRRAMPESDLPSAEEGPAERPQDRREHDTTTSRPPVPVGPDGPSGPVIVVAPEVDRLFRKSSHSTSQYCVEVAIAVLM